MKMPLIKKVLTGATIIFIFFLVGLIYIQAQQQGDRNTSVSPSSMPPLPPGENTETFTFNLKAGWNMISSPVTKIRRSFYHQCEGNLSQCPQLSPPSLELLESPLKIIDIQSCQIKYVYKFNTETNSYQKIEPSDSLDPMTGYWAFVSNDCTATIKGIRENSSKNLFAGWNLISSRYSWNEISRGYSYMQKMPPEDTVYGDFFPCRLMSKIYHWNAAKNQYDEISENAKLDDTKGYWVNVRNNCVLMEIGATADQAPKIISIKPLSGPVGTKITIYGSNFTPVANSIKIGERGYINNLNSVDGNTLQFTIPDYIAACPPLTDPNTLCPEVMRGITPGNYKLSVINKNGISNSMNFTVTKR